MKLGVCLAALVAHVWSRVPVGLSGTCSEGKRLYSEFCSRVQFSHFVVRRMASGQPSHSASAGDRLVVTVEGVAAGYTRPTTDWESVILCLRIPNRLLCQWHSCRDSGHSYIELLNNSVRDNAVTIDVHSARLERHLHRRAGEVSRKASSIKSYRSKQMFLDKSTLIDVHEGETVNASCLLDELDVVTEDIGLWIDRCDGAEAALDLLREEMRNSATTDHPPAPSPAGYLSNTGLPIRDVSERQRRRKILHLKASTERALWFVESFGLEVQSLSLCDCKSGSPLTIDYQAPVEHPAAAVAHQPTDGAIYQTLYLLERFGVSDDFFHELSMVHPSLPRSYKIKQARKTISEDVVINRLPAPHHGAYRPLEACLAASLAYEVH